VALRAEHAALHQEAVESAKVGALIARATSSALPSEAGGTSSNGSTSVTLPSGLAPGIYYLIAKTDADGIVADTAETNNSGARGFQVVSLAAAAPVIREDATSGMGAGTTEEGE
jgi:hypothetical protein